jgi:hypothetical protein
MQTLSLKTDCILYVDTDLTKKVITNEFPEGTKVEVEVDKNSTKTGVTERHEKDDPYYLAVPHSLCDFSPEQVDNFIYTASTLPVTLTAVEVASSDEEQLLINFTLNKDA